MIDAGFTKNDGGDAEPHIEEQTADSGQKADCDIAHDDQGSADDNHLDDDEDDDDEVGGEGNGLGDGGGNTSGTGGSLGDFDAALAFLGGGDIRQFGSYMMSLSSRLKNMLANIKATTDPTTRLLTLQELSELLSISTEDTLAGSFPVEQYVRELVRILGGKGAEDDDDDEGDEDQEQDEDAQLAAALAMSGGAYQGDENPEAQVLACRCLANLMEALPGVAHTVVYHGAIPVLCSKLIEISYIDLAEQTLSVCFVLSFFVLILLIHLSPLDYGEDFRRIPFFYRSRRWPSRLAQLFGFLLYCCTENCIAGCGKLLSECIVRALQYGQGCLADHPRLSVVL